MNEIARCPQETVNGISERADHLLHPRATGLLVDAGDLYAARLQLDHEEDQVPLETGQREHFDRKEVGSREAGPVCQQERLPRRALTPLGGRIDPVVLEDPFHHVPGDLVTEVRQRTLDPRVAPQRILSRHPHHEVSDLAERLRAASTSLRTAVCTSGRSTSGTSGDRVRGDDTGYLHQRASAELPAAHRESTALGVREPKRSRTKLFAEDAILFSEIVNHIFLVAIHPASNSEHEELQRMGHRERLLGRDARHRTARNDSPGLGRFFAPYEVVQLYVSARNSKVERPPKELKAFTKVALAPGETRTVRLAVPAASLAYYDEKNGWIVESGEYEVIVGRHSLDDEALRARFAI